MAALTGASDIKDEAIRSRHIAARANIPTGSMAQRQEDAQAIPLDRCRVWGATTRYAGVSIEIPSDYEAGETIILRLIAGMKTATADTTATIDAQVYRNAEDGTVGGDICATAAQTINSLTAAAKDFVITATSINPGDILDVRIAIAVNDAAGGSAVIGRIVAIKLLTDRR